MQAASGRLAALGSSDREGEGGVGSTEEASWGENARPVHSADQSEPDSGPSAPNRVSTHRSPPHGGLFDIPPPTGEDSSGF